MKKSTETIYIESKLKSILVRTGFDLKDETGEHHTTLDTLMYFLNDSPKFRKAMGLTEEVKINETENSEFKTGIFIE
jgi:hypothetical protein